MNVDPPQLPVLSDTPRNSAGEPPAFVADDITFLRRINSAAIRQQLEAIFGLVLLILLWVVLNVPVLVYGYYGVKTSIFPLCKENIAIQKNFFLRILYFVFGGSWFLILCSINMTLLLIFVWQLVGEVGGRLPHPGPRFQAFRERIRIKIERLSKKDFVKVARVFLAVIIALVGFYLFYSVVGIPVWIWMASQAEWQRSAWNTETCSGWDYKITFDGVSFDQLRTEFKNYASGQEIPSNATIISSSGESTLMTLEHLASNISVITISGPGDISTVQINFADWEYSSSYNSSSASFVNGSDLVFPSLGMKSQYSDIIDWDPYCSTPQLCLVNSSNDVVFLTILQNYDDCTMMIACANGPFEDISIPIAFVLTELERSGLCCTSPFRSSLLFLR
jgi:hypothetical protein